MSDLNALIKSLDLVTFEINKKRKKGQSKSNCNKRVFLNPISASSHGFGLLEQALKLKLPDSYKSFLSIADGGYLSPLAEYWFSFGFYHKILQDDRRTNLEYLYGIDSQINESSLVKINKKHKHYFPQMIVIGGDCADNPILMDVDTSSIYFWDLNWEDVKTKAGCMENCYLVNETFTGFIEGLKQDRL